MEHLKSFKLSICIATFNRASFIGATLESIISQATIDCEIVVLDGGSTDNTTQVVTESARHCDSLRYIRQDTNNGIDQDYDRAIESARGEYCWLMSDDDLLMPGALILALRSLRHGISLIITNAEIRSADMSSVIERRWLSLKSDRCYRTDEMDGLFADASGILQYIGCIIIKREIWLARERRRYYGSFYIHVGVIFQRALPDNALIIAEPLISYRWGNTRTFSPQLANIVFVKWPSIVASLALSESARRKDWNAEPWRSISLLLLLRGIGYYSNREYQQWIRPQLRSIYSRITPFIVSVTPGTLLNTCLMFYLSLATFPLRAIWFRMMKESPFHLRKLLRRKLASSD
jgi:abequosyltransferase